jgi:hypothetical protein
MMESVGGGGVGVGRGMREELDLRLKRENQILSREMIDL